MPSHDFTQSALRTIDMEAQAIIELKQKIGSDFEACCELLLQCKGRIVVTGIGKSGHIARKFAATLASTGSAAFFIHAAEASHGDLGMITQGDVVIAISGSGQTQELLALIPAIKRLAIPIIALVGNKDSTLARESDLALDASVSTEACPLDLAPTSSTTAALVLGDALAIALLEAKGFGADDFAFSHPGGTLGKRLLLKVNDAMESSFPSVAPDTSLLDAIDEISQKGLGMTTVLDANKKLLGVFTDGDLRRCLTQHKSPAEMPIEKLMTTECKTISDTALAAEALKIMQDYSVSSLVALDNHSRVSGVIHIHALINAGLA